MKNGPMIVILLRRYFPLSNILFALSVYIVGIIIAWADNQLRAFFEVYYLYLGIFGIAWVSSAFNWAFSWWEPTLKEFHTCFEIDDKDYKEIFKENLQLLYDDRKTIFFSLPGFILTVLFFIMVYLKFIPLPSIISTEIIFRNPLYWIYGIIFVSICIFLLFSGIYYIINGFKFINKISKLKLKINILEINRRNKLSKLGELILLGALSWFVGVSLITIVSFTYINIFIICFLTLTIILGLFALFVPQYVLHKSIVKGKKEILTEISKEFSNVYSLPIVNNQNQLKIQTLCILYSEVEKLKEWPFEKSMIIKILSTTAIPILTTLIKIYIPFP